MSTSYTVKNVSEMEDSAPKFGFGEIQEARFCGGALDAERTGLAYHRLRPGMRSPFGHKHEEAEEVYLVLSGSGRAKLDDDVVDLNPLDAVRVAPAVVRAFEAGPDGLELIAFGPHHAGDGEMLPGWWPQSE